MRKPVYPDQFFDDYEIFNENLLSEKGDFHSNLNIAYLTAADYMHANRDWKDLK